MATFRTGNHQPQNVYRDDQYIGVMFTAEDAALVVEALNDTESGEKAACGRTNPHMPHDFGEMFDEECAGIPGPVADSCTCPLPSGADPACPVHQGRRARGPKPLPVGPGCICDGSGRTCPRHGAVM
jgi:hypothetical protein